MLMGAQSAPAETGAPMGVCEQGGTGWMNYGPRMWRYEVINSLNGAQYLRERKPSWEKQEEQHTIVPGGILAPGERASRAVCVLVHTGEGVTERHPKHGSGRPVPGSRETGLALLLF